MVLVKEQAQESYVGSRDVVTDKDLSSDNVAIKIIPQKREVCQLDAEKSKGKATKSRNDEFPVTHCRGQKDNQMNPVTDSAEDDSGESFFNATSSSSSDAEDEDEPLDVLKKKGWMDKVPTASPPLQHEMDGHVLPITNPSDFGDVCIKNSSNVHLGSRVFYKGPVTIKQFVYTNSGMVPDETNHQSLQYNENLSNDTTSNDCKRKSHQQSTLSKSPSDVFSYLSNEKVAELFCKRKCIFTICIMALILLLCTIMAIWLSGRIYSEKHPNIPISLNDSSINNGLTIPGVRVISRVEWGGQPPSKSPTPLGVNPAPYVIISHTASVFCYTQAQCVLNVRVAQTFHVESRGWNDIAYNFLVGGDGLVYEGRGWGVEGAHTFNYNYQSIGISFIGTFNELEPTEAQLHAAQKLIELGVQGNYISKDYKLLGHRQCIKTESPGEALYNIIKGWQHWSPTP